MLIKGKIIILYMQYTYQYKMLKMFANQFYMICEDFLCVNGGI